MWCSAVGVIVAFTLGLLAAPLATDAQPSAHIPKVADRKNKRPFRPCLPAARRRQLLLARGAGGVLSALSVARSSGAQQGVAWFCGSLDLRLRREEGCGSGVSRCEDLGTTGWGKPGGAAGTPLRAGGVVRVAPLQRAWYKGRPRSFNLN